MSDSATTASNGAPILLAEDEPGLQEALAMLLEIAGYRVMLAYDGKSALRKLEEELPQLVLTDYMMPGMDGLALAAAIRSREDGESLPIVLLSAAELDEEKAIESGVDVYLRKPVPFDELHRVIRSLLGR